MEKYRDHGCRQVCIARREDEVGKIPTSQTDRRAELTSGLALLRPQLHQQENHRIRREHKDDHNRRISPPVIIILQIKRVEIIRAVAILANPAPARGIRVREIVPRSLSQHVVREIGRARLAVRGVEDGEFGLGAVDRDAPGGEDEEGTHEVVEGIEVVHPIPPEDLDLAVRDQYTTEGDEHTDQQGIDQGSEHGIGGVGSDELADTGIHKLVHDHDEEDGARFVGVCGETDRVVPADEIEDGTDTEIRKFGDDETDDECDPAVHL